MAGKSGTKTVAHRALRKQNIIVQHCRFHHDVLLFWWIGNTFSPCWRDGLSRQGGLSNCALSGPDSPTLPEGEYSALRFFGIGAKTHQLRASRTALSVLLRQLGGQIDIYHVGNRRQPGHDVCELSAQILS